MRWGLPRIALGAVLLLAAMPAASAARLPVPPLAPSATNVLRSGTVVASVGQDSVTLTNGLVTRIWARSPFLTERIVDERRGGLVVAGRAADFALRLAGAGATSDAFVAAD